MKKILRWTGCGLLLVLVCALAAGAWFFLIDGRAPARRPDLERVPVQFFDQLYSAPGTHPPLLAPLPPPGFPFPTTNALYAAFMLNLIDLADVEAEHPAPGGVTVEKDIVYGKVGERDLLLDVYRPTKLLAKSAPILIFIHGGGWSSGDKHDYQIYCNRFALWGYVTASISYRHVKEAKFPGCVQDTNASIRFLRANAARFGGDPDRIAVVGGSAGGHLSMMAAYASDVPELQGDAGNPGVSSRVQAVVDLYGPTNLTVPEARNNPTVTKFFDKSYDEAPEAFKLASPITHLDKDDPPTLIIQGTLDTTVEPSQSDALAERLKALGADYWYDRIDGWPHTLDLAQVNFEHTSHLIREFLRAKGLGAE